MGDVIEVNFTDIKEDSGYIMDGESVRGVYKGDVIAVKKDDDTCMLGFRSIGGVVDPIELTIEELNEFCLMWLLIFNPSVIKEDDQDE